jgi:hypothetical protein
MACDGGLLQMLDSTYGAPVRRTYRLAMTITAFTLISVGCVSDGGGQTDRVSDWRAATADVPLSSPPLTDEEVVESAEGFCDVARSAADVPAFVDAVVALGEGMYLDDVGRMVDASLRGWCSEEHARLMANGTFWRLLDENKSAIELGAEARASGPSRTPTELDKERLDLMREALRGSDDADLVLMADAITVEDLIVGSEIYCPNLDEAGSLDAFMSELERSYYDDPGPALASFAALKEFIGYLVFLFCL